MDGVRAAPALVGIDWGGSNLRVALLSACGRLLARRESAAGVFALPPGGFAAALWPLCGDWLRAHRVPLLACGMIGSRQGIVEAPYVACPATLDDLVAGLARVTLGAPFDGDGAAATLFVVPGLKTGSAADGWDVARGEETQLCGTQAAGTRCFVLPGTHSKWMRRGDDGRIEDFRTYLTGELFELLSSHGSLARVMGPAEPSPAAFAQGVAQARGPLALPSLLFRVRAAALMGAWPASALPDYLSGLLIGAEVEAGLRELGGMGGTGGGADSEPLTLIGAPALTRRYAQAMAACGVAVREEPGEAAFAGLLAIARRAGLVTAEAAAR